MTAWCNRQMPFTWADVSVWLSRALGHAARFLFLLLVLGPLLAIPLDPARVAVPAMDVWRLLLPQGRRLTLLLRSLGLGAAVALTGMALGTLIALQLWRCRRPPLGWLRWACLVLIAVPPYIHALAWSEMTTGTLGEALSMHRTGWWLSWWVQTMAFLPLASGLALVSLESLNPELIAIGRVYRDDGACLRRVILPLVAPNLLASGGLLFALSSLDYSVPSLFQVNVYALDIFAEYSATANPVRALLISMPLLVICLIVVMLAQMTLRRAGSQGGWRLPAWQVAPRWSQSLRSLQVAALGIALLQLVVPVIALFAGVEGMEEFLATIGEARRELAFTGEIGLLAACLALPLALPVARRLVQGGRCATFWWPLVAFNLAVPPPLVGVGLISQWRRLAPNVVYGSWLMPVLVALNRYLPWAVLLIQAHLRRVDTALLDAGRVFQPNRRLGWLYVRLPILAPALLSAAALIMAFSMGELGGTLIVAPPGRATLAMRVYNYLHYGASSAVAGLCLALLFGTIGAGAVSSVILRWWARMNM